jgi:dTDP-4-dehydrorhamnose reductase
MEAVVVGRGWVGTKLGALMGLPVLSHTEIFKEYRNFDTVINCAGRTGVPTVDECEEHKAETITANTIFPMELFSRCYGRRLVHFSSGCIYQGGPWKAQDTPNYDASIYSASKLVSDQFLKDKALVLRIRMPFCAGDHPKNLLTKLRKYAETGRLLDGYNSLSDVDEMIMHAANLITDRKVGPCNLVNTGAIWTHELAEMMGLTPQWFKFGEFTKPRSECRLIPSVVTRPVREALEKALNS